MWWMLTEKCDEQVLDDFPFCKILVKNIVSLALIVFWVKRIQAMQFVHNRVTVVCRIKYLQRWILMAVLKKNNGL